MMLHSFVICFQIARLWQRNVFARQPHGIAPGWPGRLDRSDRSASPVRAARSTPHRTPSPARKSAKNIVFISPDNLSRPLLGSLLKKEGYAVTSFPDIAHFRSGTVSRDCDCLILDIDHQHDALLRQDYIELAAEMRDQLPIVLIAPPSSLVPDRLDLPAVSKRSRGSHLLRGISQTLFGTGSIHREGIREG